MSETKKKKWIFTRKPKIKLKTFPIASKSSDLFDCCFRIEVRKLIDCYMTIWNSEFPDSGRERAVSNRNISKYTVELDLKCAQYQKFEDSEGRWKWKKKSKKEKKNIHFDCQQMKMYKFGGKITTQLDLYLIASHGFEIFLVAHRLSNISRIKQNWKK